MEFPFFISACTVLRTLFPLLKYLSDERERKGKKKRKSVTLFANAFLAFFISRVSPPAAPFSSPFLRIRLRLCSFIPPREKRVFFQDSRVLSSIPLFISFFLFRLTKPVFLCLAFPFFILLLCTSFLFRNSAIFFFPTSFFVYAFARLGTKPVLFHQVSAKRCI